MSRIAFVSGCDSNYFPLLLEWLHSLRSFPEGKAAAVCILDSGLSPAQHEKLAPLVTKIHKPDWPCAIPASRTAGKEFLKSCLCRPFIREYFPGYDIYFWMDADTWIQSWRGVDLFIKGARRGKITLTGQADRSYPRQLRVKWLGRWPWKVRGFYFSNALKAFGFKTARELLPYHVLLAGAFALDKDAPHWERWQALVKIAIRKGKLFTAEQLSLGVMCYREGYSFELLPAWCHWLCEFKPLIDDGTGKFVEPFLPHEEIGILHLSGYDAMRLDRSIKTDFTTVNGSSVSRSYRYPFFDGTA